MRGPQKAAVSLRLRQNFGFWLCHWGTERAMQLPLKQILSGWQEGFRLSKSPRTSKGSKTPKAHLQLCLNPVVLTRSWTLLSLFHEGSPVGCWIAFRASLPPVVLAGRWRSHPSSCTHSRCRPKPELSQGPALHCGMGSGLQSGHKHQHLSFQERGTLVQPCLRWYKHRARTV